MLLSCAVKVCLADRLAVALNPLGDADDVGTASARDKMSITAAICRISSSVQQATVGAPSALLKRGLRRLWARPPGESPSLSKQILGTGCEQLPRQAHHSCVQPPKKS